MKSELGGRNLGDTRMVTCLTQNSEFGRLGSSAPFNSEIGTRGPRVVAHLARISENRDTEVITHRSPMSKARDTGVMTHNSELGD